MRSALYLANIVCNGSKLFVWYVGIDLTQKPGKTAKKGTEGRIWVQKETEPPFKPLIKDKNLTINNNR